MPGKPPDNEVFCCGDRNYLRRIETLASFAASISHDYNNALTVVLGNLSLARIEAEGNSELQEVLKDAESASLRIKKLTERLTLYARGLKPMREVFTLEELVRKTTEVTLENYKGKFEIIIKNSGITVGGDSSQIGLALSELLVNASEAVSGPEGFISVILEEAEVDEEILFREIELTRGRYALVTVKDNGPGVQQGIAKDIFDPYFTTEPEKQGIGLALVYAVIKRHRGFISAATGEGGGAVFTLYLPVT